MNVFGECIRALIHEPESIDAEIGAFRVAEAIDIYIAQNTKRK